MLLSRFLSRTKRMRKIFFFLALFVFLMGNAQSLVFITKDNVNVRKAPQNGAVLLKAKNGMVFQKISEENGWTKITDPTGMEAFVSTQFTDVLTAEELKVYKAADIMVSAQEAEEAGYEGPYMESETKSGGSSDVSWIFYGNTEGKDMKVGACCRTQLVYNNGRMRTVENYYAGQRKGWYILLTEQVDYEGKVEGKLEKPILVYPAFSNTGGVFVDHHYYPDMQDTDNWE